MRRSLILALCLSGIGPTLIASTAHADLIAVPLQSDDVGSSGLSAPEKIDPSILCSVLFPPRSIPPIDYQVSGLCRVPDQTGGGFGGSNSLQRPPVSQAAIVPSRDNRDSETVARLVIENALIPSDPLLRGLFHPPRTAC